MERLGEAVDAAVAGDEPAIRDRIAGDQFRQAFPAIADNARAFRQFLRRGIQYLVTDAGIRQFLDVGTGLPTAQNTHEVAQLLEPTARVVYVDNDPLVLAHARALMTSTAEGRTAFVLGDFMEPDAFLNDPKLQETLNLDEPVGLLLIAMLRFNARSNPVPSRTTHNTFIEVAWTIVPIMILLVIAVPSFKLLFFQLNVPPADLTVKATGKQWYWSYSYPDNGKFEFDSLMLQDQERQKVTPEPPRLLAVDNEMVVVLRVGLVVPYGARAATAAFATLYETLVMMASGGLLAGAIFLLWPGPPIAVPVGGGRSITAPLALLSLAIGGPLLVLAEARIFPKLAMTASMPFPGVGREALPVALGRRLLPDRAMLAAIRRHFRI